MRREICPLCGDLVEDCNCSVEYGYFQPDYMGRMGSTAAFHHDPEYTWRCYLAADTWFGAEEGKQPCWFRRKMQELVLGIKWRKTNETEKRTQRENCRRDDKRSVSERRNGTES